MAWKSPSHRLDRVDVTVRLPQPGPEPTWRLETVGRSEGQRASLWHREVSWALAEVDNGLQVCDEVNWFLHAVLQDRPSSPFWLDRAMRGLPVGVQLELPW